MDAPVQNLESRWVTYLRTAAWILPGLFLWIAACTIMVPKLKEICASSNLSLSAPVILALQVSEFIKDNFIWGSAVTLLLLLMLEWRSRKWARCRRPVFGVLAYVVNLAVLVALAALCLLAVFAGAKLLQTK